MLCIPIYLTKHFRDVCVTLKYKEKQKKISSDIHDSVVVAKQVQKATMHVLSTMHS